MGIVRTTTFGSEVSITNGITTVVEIATKGPKGDRGLQGIPGNPNTGSLFISASVTGSTINLERGNGTVVPLTILGSTNWNYNAEYIIKDTEQLTFYGDYVLTASYLHVEGNSGQIEYSPGKYFKKMGSMFIGGNLLIKDSVIENDGLIKVSGSVVLLGDSQIIGTGTII
jgi:hypothetical protein